MPNIVEFLTARLDETQASAEAWDEAERAWRQVGARNLRYDNGSGERVQSIDIGGGQGLLNEQIWVKHDYDGERTAHIARHDPARVLAEVKAKRAIMQAHACVWLVNQWVEFAPGQRRRGELRVCRACEPVSGFMTDQWPCLTLKLLAAPYVDHPDYKQEWQVG